MVSDRRYKRYFIILENEDRGFAKTDKRMPKGYAKIEVRNGKGLLNVYVQDLKYFKDAKYIYRNYLISTKGQKGKYVDTGAFMIDEKGKGELRVRFNPDNVEGSQMSIEDFNVVAVIAKPIERSSDENEVYGPLIGYMDKEKVDWKNILMYEDNVMKENDKIDKEYKEKYEEIINVIEKSSKEIYKEDEEEEEKGFTEPIEKHGNELSSKYKYKEKPSKEIKPQKKEEIKPQKKEEIKPQKKEEIKPQKKEEIKPQKKEEVKPQKKEEVKPQKKEEVKPQKKEEVKPQKKEEVKPQKKEEVKPQKKEEIKPQKKEEVKPQKKEEIKPQKKEEIKPQKKEEIKPQKKEEVKPQKKDKSKKHDKNQFSKRTEIHYKKYHKMVYKYVKDILKYHEKVEPFEKNIEGYKWWKMNYDRQSIYRGFLPFFGYILSIYANNPYVYYMNNCYNLMNKYGHYIFGVAYDKDMEVKYYVYGVPGRYVATDQPCQGMTGFISWYPLEDREPEKGDYGYWLLHIDSKTGNAVFPMKPTVPPMN